MVEESDRSPLIWHLPGDAMATLYFSGEVNFFDVDFAIRLGNTSQKLTTSIALNKNGYLPIEEFEGTLIRQTSDLHLIVYLLNNTPHNFNLVIAFIFPGRDEQLYPVELKANGWVRKKIPVQINFSKVSGDKKTISLS